MNARQVLVNSNELELIQRDIINDFLKVEDSLKKDVDTLTAKISMVVSFMRIIQHKSLNDFEFIYESLKFSDVVVLPSRLDS